MPNRKRLLRISLRTLLVLVTCAGLVIAWAANHIRTRKSALAAIRKAGGEIRINFHDPTQLEEWFGPDVCGDVMNIDMRKGSADNDLLLQIARISELRRLDLSDADIDDAGLRSISALPLRELWLQSTKITDASAATISEFKSLDFLQLNATSLSDRFLEELKSLPELENLGLRGTGVTSAGMSFLSRHPKLKDVDLYHTEVDDSGVAQLVACQSLTEIGLSATKVTDAVFEHLDKLSNLEAVDMSGNRPVSTEAVLAFEESHPKCDVEWYRN